MDTNRFDDIFLVKGAIPFLAGFYIGMDDEKAQERLDNLYGNQNEQLTENLLSRYSVSYEYELFESENLLKKIILVFPQECSYKDTVLLIDYFNNRFYHEKIHKEIENDSGGNLIKFRVDFSNYYYSCSFFNNDGKFFIQLEGLVAYPSLYKAFYLVGTDSDLKGFIHKSLSFSYNETNKDTILNDLFPVYNGLPTVCGVYLGQYAGSSSEAEGIIDDIIHNPDLYHKFFDYRDISFEVMLDCYDQIDEIIMRMSEENKDVALKIINHLKQRLLIEQANYYAAEGTEGQFKLLVNMSNGYFSVKADTSYCSTTNRRDIEISIKVQKEGRDLYQSLYVMLCDNTHYNYFKEADVFYHYDSENNYSPVGAYNSFKEANDAFCGN